MALSGGKLVSTECQPSDAADVEMAQLSETEVGSLGVVG